MLLKPVPLIYRKRTRPRRIARTAPAPAAPVLTSATFADGTLNLTFDRAMDFSGIIPSGLIVLDSSVPVEWGGTADVTTSETGISVVMIENGEYLGSGLWLESPAGAGIKSAEGIAWDGAVDVELPYST
jgi:hypothetical protein